MSGKISADPHVTTLSGTEKIACVQSGANKQLTPADILSYVVAQNNTFTGLQILNGKLGLGADPSTSAQDSTVLCYMTRTTAVSTGRGILQHNYYELTPANNGTVQTAMLGEIKIDGTGTAGAGHSIGGIFLATDSVGTAGQFSGLEGKRVCLGTSDAGAAIFGITDYNMASATGRTAVCFNAWAEFYNGTPATPITTGGFVAYLVTTPTGGDPTKFVALSAPANFVIQTGGIIKSYDAASYTKYCGFSHNGTDGIVTTNAGNLELGAAGGFVITQSGVGFVPLASGAACGLTSNYWAFIGTHAAHDGTAGQTATITTFTSLTFKDGLLTAHA